jgi:hypothetical protein
MENEQQTEQATEPAPGTVKYACLQWIQRQQVYPRLPITAGHVPRTVDAAPPAPAPTAPPTAATPPAQWRNLGEIYAAKLAAQGGGIRGGPKK